MVRVIYTTVVAGIDRFAADIDTLLDDNDLNGAEGRRLTFKKETAELAGRASRTGDSLADLAREFSAISGRPVIPPSEET